MSGLPASCSLWFEFFRCEFLFTGSFVCYQ